MQANQRTSPQSKSLTLLLFSFKVGTNKADLPGGRNEKDFFDHSDFAAFSGLGRGAKHTQHTAAINNAKFQLSVNLTVTVHHSRYQFNNDTDHDNEIRDFNR